MIAVLLLFELKILTKVKMKINTNNYIEDNLSHLMCSYYYYVFCVHFPYYQLQSNFKPRPVFEKFLNVLPNIFAMQNF